MEELGVKSHNSWARSKFSLQANKINFYKTINGHSSALRCIRKRDLLIFNLLLATPAPQWLMLPSYNIFPHFATIITDSAWYIANYTNTSNHQFLRLAHSEKQTSAIYSFGSYQVCRCVDGAHKRFPSDFLVQRLREGVGDTRYLHLRLLVTHITVC